MTVGQKGVNFYVNEFCFGVVFCLCVDLLVYCGAGIAQLVYRLATGIESRWGGRFFVPVQTGPGAHPASSTMGSRSLPGVMRPGRGVNHPVVSSAEVKERVELYLCPPSGLSWPVQGRTYLLVYWTLASLNLTWTHSKGNKVQGGSNMTGTICV
jgi:hypothetical protein